MMQTESQKHHRVIANKCNLKLKTEVFTHYTDDKLACKCGINNLCQLTIDHINNDGNLHRKDCKYTGIDFYRWLKNKEFPTDFQVLCWNCQFRKRSVYNETKRITVAAKSKFKYVQNLKKVCLQKYGEICSCGESDIVVLTLDHVNNDGAEHRRNIKTTSGCNFYCMLRKNNFPNNPPLQVLCVNCQYLK